MAYASRSGRARTSSSRPQAFGVCQRCGIWYNRVDLTNQYAWRGAALLPTWVFVCQRCYDVPQEQDRAIVPPADPIPVQLALPEDFDAAEADYMGLTLGSTIDPQTGIPVPGRTAMSTVGGTVMGPAPSGRPTGYYALDNAPVTAAAVPLYMAEVTQVYMAEATGVFMATDETSRVPAPPDDGVLGDPMPVVSLIADGTPVVTASCTGPHGLALNDQVYVRGSGNPLADGMFSVIPLTATVFTYGCYSPIGAGSLLEPLTVIVTVLAGLPRSYPALPEPGP